MNLKECFEKRRLRKVRPSFGKSGKSFRAAERKLRRAKELFRDNFFDEAVVASYTSMFNAARALLFKEGVVEKSHYCVVEYLKEKYKQKLSMKYIGWLNTYREGRHAVLYDIEGMEVDKSEAEESIKKAEEFLGAVKELLRDSKSP